MNCQHTYDQNLILQQYLILQQMLIYNQMLKASFNKNISTPKILIPKLEEIDISNSQTSKHDDTYQIQIQQEQNIKTKPQKIQKKQELKKFKILNNNNNESVEIIQKKRVFLSMLDIKEVQYKKFKVQQNEDNKNNVSAIVDTQI
ncbi:unnamed protein product [Paramecium pentaurelia]|uniref:Uncharacterized protein n=1 Tax=Paramecium pentaurelia TaxID=43138 RepID=A0A8S1T1T6_9CILI|nr:unnamed protein product [Paramecium pentaurelia]